MVRTDISIARFADHSQAEQAVKALAQAGVDMKQMSIVGRGYHTEENVIGFYNAGERIRFWGKYGAFWGSLWGLFGAGIFLVSPLTGPVMALGGLAVTVLSALEGASPSAAPARSALRSTAWACQRTAFSNMSVR